MQKNLDFTPIHNLPDGGIANTDLVNGEHIIVKCRKCSKSLADLWVTIPKYSMESEVIATCDYCGDQSFKTTVAGKFQTGITDESNHVDIEFDDLRVDEKGKVFQRIKIITKRA